MRALESFQLNDDQREIELPWHRSAPKPEKTVVFPNMGVLGGIRIVVIGFSELHVAFAPSVHVVPAHSPFLNSLNSTRLLSLTGSSQATGYPRIHLHRICHSAINPGRCSAAITLVQLFFRVSHPGPAFPLQWVVNQKKKKKTNFDPVGIPVLHLAPTYVPHLSIRRLHTSVLVITLSIGQFSIAFNQQF